MGFSPKSTFFLGVNFSDQLRLTRWVQVWLGKKGASLGWKRVQKLPPTKKNHFRKVFSKKKFQKTAKFKRWAEKVLFLANFWLFFPVFEAERWEFGYPSGIFGNIFPFWQDLKQKIALGYVDISVCFSKCIFFVLFLQVRVFSIVFFSINKVVKRMKYVWKSPRGGVQVPQGPVIR